MVPKGFQRYTAFQADDPVIAYGPLDRNGWLQHWCRLGNDLGDILKSVGHRLDQDGKVGASHVILGQV